MPKEAKVIDRGALYYPFIHVRDTNWLKATLLCFPFMDRMVPDGYEVNDDAAATFFAGKPGRLGRSMLGRRDLGDPATQHARSELLQKLKEDLTAGRLAERFSREAAKGGAYKDGESAFQIHEYKLGGALLKFLKSHGLAWVPPIPVRGNANWWAVHPILGETIMSTNAVALAKAHDLEIVTSDGPIHQALLGTTAAEVYDILVRQRLFGMPRPESEKVNDLLRFIIVSEFDLKKLSLEDIAELNQQRSDLSALKAELLAQVDDVGAVPDQEVWNDVLSVRAKEVVKEWGERASVRSLFKRVDPKAWGSDAASVWKEVAPKVVAGAGTAAIVTGLVGILPGVIVGAVFGTVSLIYQWRKSQRTFKLFSHLAQKGAHPRHLLEVSPA